MKNPPIYYNKRVFCYYMELLEKIFKLITLTESVDAKDVEDAIDNHNRVIINYHSKGEDNNTGARVIEVYAYGLTKAGNPVIRAWQPYGDTTSRVPSWKFFRLDRISEWQPTKQVFTHPADFYYKNIGKFNPNDDKTMAIVYKIAKFGNEELTTTPKTTEPKTKEDVFKSSSEYKMERFGQHADNPITLSDIKTNDAFKQLGKVSVPKSSEPKTKDDVYRPSTEQGEEQKTQHKSQEELNKQLDKLRKTLGDKPITLSDLNKKMKEEDIPQETRWQDIFNADAERDLEQMHKNDMINQRRRDNRWQKSADSRALHRKGSLNRAFD